MLKKLTLIGILVLTGCAHATVHQVCSRPEVLKEYRDYDQCYEEVTIERQQAHERRQNFARNWSNSFSNHNRCGGYGNPCR